LSAARVKALPTLFEQTICFHLDEPRQINEAGDLHERARRADFTKKLAMCARIPPFQDIHEHNPGSYYLLHSSAGLADCVTDDFSAAKTDLSLKIGP